MRNFNKKVASSSNYKLGIKTCVTEYEFRGGTKYNACLELRLVPKRGKNKPLTYEDLYYLVLAVRLFTNKK